MSKQYLNFVQTSLRHIIFLTLTFDVFSSEKIDINNILNNIEVVSSSQERRKGLMNRKFLPENHGMFFIWDYRKRQCMWMRDTYIPLSVAYINNEGKILEIYDMVPHSEKSVCSIKRVKYALEVNKDWFEKNNINIGDMLNIRVLIQNDK